MTVRCGQCGKGFESRRAWQRFCSQACRGAWHARAKYGSRNLERVCELLRAGGHRNAANYLERELGRGNSGLPAPQLGG